MKKSNVKKQNELDLNQHIHFQLKGAVGLIKQV